MRINTLFLKPGDHLLYNIDKFWPDPSGYLMDLAIRIKTVSANKYPGPGIAHIEVYDGNGMSLAARADGVNRYSFRADDLQMVRRPLHWDHAKAQTYFATVRGQDYDYAGLFCFTLAVAQGSAKKQFCSELARNLGRAAGSLAFDPAWPGDKVAPGNFQMVSDFVTLNERGEVVTQINN